jgi:hypothetical protein
MERSSPCTTANSTTPVTREGECVYVCVCVCVYMCMRQRFCDHRELSYTYTHMHTYTRTLPRTNFRHAGLSKNMKKAIRQVTDLRSISFDAEGGAFWFFN